MGEIRIGQTRISPNLLKFIEGKFCMFSIKYIYVARAWNGVVSEIYYSEIFCDINEILSQQVVKSPIVTDICGSD